MKRIICCILFIVPVFGFSQYLPKGYELDTTFDLQHGYVRELLMPISSNHVYFINVVGNSGEIITIDLTTNIIINRYSNLKNCIYFEGIDSSEKYLYYYDLKSAFLIKKSYRIDLKTGEVQKIKVSDVKLDKNAFRGYIGMVQSIYSRDQEILIRIPPIPSSKIEIYKFIKN